MRLDCNPREAGRLFGLPHGTINQWIDEGFVSPSGKYKATGYRCIDLRGLMQLSVTRALKRKGASGDTIRPLTDYLGSTTVAELKAALDRGETLLATAGSALPARLMKPGTLILNRSGHDELLVAVDLGNYYEFIVGLFSRNSERPKESAAVEALT